MTLVPTPPPASPTGQPMLSPRLAPYLFVLVTLCGCLAGASQLDLGLSPKVFGWAVLGGMFFGSLLAATPGFRKAAPMVLLVLSLGFSSCSHTPPLVITARSIAALDETFVGTANMMEAALDAHHVTAEQYAQWRDFGLRYQASEELALKLYDAAAAAHDTSTQGQAAAVLASFETELATYTALVFQAVHPDGGP